MKTAYELRNGNVIIVNKKPQVVLKTEYHCSGRNASVVRIKMKDLFTGILSENTYRADDKFEYIVLDKKKCIYSYFSSPNMVFMDEEYLSYEINQEDIDEQVLRYLEEGVECQLVFYQEQPLSVEFSTNIIREIQYTEPAIRGDSTGKVMKEGTLKTGYIIPVPLYCAIGDRIEIDPQTHEFRKRINH